MISLKQRFARNVGFKTIADFVSRLATAAVTVVLARLLSQEEFGLLSYAMAIAASAVFFLDIGWNVVLMRKAKDAHFSTYLLSIFLLKILLCAAFVVFAVLFPFHALDKVSKSMFIFCFLFSAAMSFQDYMGATIAGKERFDLEWIARIVPRWLPLLFLWLFMRHHPGSEGAAMVLGISSFGLTLLMMVLVFKWLKLDVRSPNLATIKTILIDGLPFGIAAIVWGLSTKIDTILLGLYDVPLAKIGVYAAVVKILDFFRGIGIIVYVSMVPIFTDFQNDPLKIWGLLKKLCWISFGLFVLALPILYWGSPHLMRLLYGPSYEQGGSLLWMGLIGILIFIFHCPFQAVIAALGKGKLSLIGSMLLFLTSCAINVTFIPQYQLKAAIAAIVMGEIVWLATDVYFLRRRLKMVHPV